MRSCALRILLAATISMALVIFCVFLILAILPRISLAPAMSILYEPYPLLERGEEFVAALLERGFDFLGQIRLRVDAFEQLPVGAARERLQRGLGLDHLAPVD